MKITILGCGSSLGVPVIGCKCPVCLSADSKNKRLRASILLEMEGQHLVVDLTPDFRQQALHHKITKLDAVFITHGHADHTHGIDDIRPYNFFQNGAVKVFCDPKTAERLRISFSYIFQMSLKPGLIPMLDVVETTSPFEFAGQNIQPLEVIHGRWTTFGLRAGNFAYVTDTNGIPDETLDKMRGLDLLIIDALQREPHPTHFCIAESLAVIEKLKPKRAVLTHMTHELDYSVLSAELPKGVEPAYDGMTFELHEGG